MHYIIFIFFFNHRRVPPTPILDWHFTLVSDKSIRSDLTDQIVVLEGSLSDTKPVTSGVPQGTVLGPLLFLVYLNDLPQCVTSSHTRLFADDCLIYKEIRSQVDADELQADLDALQEWEQQWMMSFHPHKCQLLRITR